MCAVKTPSWDFPSTEPKSDKPWLRNVLEDLTWFSTPYTSFLEIWFADKLFFFEE
jgi:hypothetical protein